MKTDLFQSCGHCCFPNLLAHWVQHFHSIIFFFLGKPKANGAGEGNGTPFQYSCLDNPMDRGAWSDTTERLHFHFSLSCIREGNDNPLQCSCLENTRDGAAWWAAVYGVTQSRTQLKRLSRNSSSSIIGDWDPTAIWCGNQLYFTWMLFMNRGHLSHYSGISSFWDG